MHLLLDTQILLWQLSEDGQLTEKAKSLIANAESRTVSAASLWEIAIKTKIGKLKADIEKILGQLEPSGILELPITSRHAAQVGKLPLLHGDPFDRMLIAQAISEPLYLLTADSQLAQYSSLVIKV